MIFLPKIAAAEDVLEEWQRRFQGLKQDHNRAFAQKIAELAEWEQTELDALEAWDEPTTY